MIAALVLSLAVNAYGVPGTGTLTVDANGDFTRAFSAGPASEREGWNGHDAWRADATGFARVQGDLAERNEIRGWSRAFRGALFAGTAQAQTASSQERVHISFGGLHRVGGTWIPQTIVSHSDTNGSWTARVTAVRTIDAADVDFAPPSPPDDATLRGDTTSVPLEMRGSPTVVVRVNGAAVRVYADTGGQNVITESAARRAGMHVVGGGFVAGGGGTSPIRYAWASSVRLGHAVLNHQPFIVLPDARLPGDAAGVIGYEVFARFAARFDEPHKTLTLARDPSAFGPPANVVPFTFIDRQPEVAGAIDGIAGPISIDTGSSLTGDVTASFVAQHDLLRRLHAHVTAQAAGVGGKYSVFLVRAHTLRVGTETIADPLLDLNTQPGVWDAGGPILNLGFATLERWIVVLDYAHGQLQLRPGGNPAGNIVHDRSGVVLVPHNGALLAATVLTGTPAARAGIVTGTVITRVNGRAVRAADLKAVQTLLSGRPGTRVMLQSANGVRHTLVLERFL